MQKILIIEDDPLIGKTIQMKIEYVAAQKGVEVEVSRAFDGEEGLAVISVKKPDFIVLDLMMPKKSGFEVLEGIKKIGLNEIGNPHIMVLTNLSGEEVRVKGLGASSYFVKSNTGIKQIAEYIFQEITKGN